jgi:Putative lumazine-binding
VGDAGRAMLEEQGFGGTVSFTDFLTLVQLDGAWRIANKTFVHTGGEPPAM